jgi:glycosyltransferase involved in cell wall biosynthesis
MGDMKPEISLVIPAFNEEKTIERIIRDSDSVFRKNFRDYEIIVIDDSSTDRTKEICENLGNQLEKLALHTNEKRSGKTAAVTNGFRLSKSDVISFIDADYQYSPKDIPRLFKKLNEGYDICSGKRTERKDSLKRHVLSNGFNLFNRYMFGIRIDDVNCGLKMFRREVLDKVRLKYLKARWFIDTEMLARAQRMGFRITQIPIEHRHREEGSSKINIYKILIETFTYAFRLKARFIIEGQDREP